MDGMSLFAQGAPRLKNHLGLVQIINCGVGGFERGGYECPKARWKLTIDEMPGVYHRESVASILPQHIQKNAIICQQQAEIKKLRQCAEAKRLFSRVICRARV